MKCLAGLIVESKESKMLLSERIKEARKAAGLKQAEFSRRIGVGESAVSQWESGRIKSLSGENALAIEAITGYRAYWIVHGRGPKRCVDANIWPLSPALQGLVLALSPEEREKLNKLIKSYLEL